MAAGPGRLIPTADPMRPMILLAASGLYWWLICRLSGVNESWDADAYWRLWYPLSVALSAAGWFFGKRGWLAGAIVTFAQLPVMWITSGTGPLWPIGLTMSAVLALPAIALSTLTGWIAHRKPST